MENKIFLKADELEEYIGISIPATYKTVCKLDYELAAQGYITLVVCPGRSCLEKKIHGGTV